jgi:hypothetical protein
MCKLSSTNTGDCNTIPTISDCNSNPSNPGCGVYGSLDVCTPGYTYNASLCNCQTNPKSAGCPGYVSGGLANFATGTSLRAGTGPSAGGGGGISGNLKPSSSDINVSGSDDEVASNAQLSGISGSAPGGGGGSPGGGGGGVGGGAPPADPVAAAPEEKGLGGLFNQAKSFMSGAFGSKKADSGNGNIKNSKNPNAADASKFRPSRRVASKSGFGTKNQDIWLMMNRCFVAESCAGNNNNFLDSALKQK